MLQVLRIALGLGLAILAAVGLGAALGLPLVPRPEVFEPPIFSVARAALPYLPFLGALGLCAVAVAEHWRLPQLIYWLLAGCVIAMVSYHALQASGVAPAALLAQPAPLKFVIMGAFGGFIHWLVAGRRAGSLSALLDDGRDLADTRADQERRRCAVCAVVWLLLGLVPLGLLGWHLLYNASPSLARRVTTAAEADGAKLLAAAGLTNLALKVDGYTGHVTGAVADAAAKVSAFAKAKDALAPLTGVPGVVAALQNDIIAQNDSDPRVAEENARIRAAAEADARKKAEDERLAAVAEAKRKAADEEARRKAEEERLAAEAEAKRKADEEAARKKKAEEERLAAEAEAKRKAAEEEARKAEEARLAAAAERDLAEIAAKRKALEEEQRKAEAERLAQIEAERKQQEAEAQAKAAAEAKATAEAEAARKKAEEERLAAEVVAKRKAEEEAARKKAEEERLAAEVAAKRKAEEEAARKKAEEERLAAEVAAKRKAEEEAARKKAEDERLAAEAEAKRKAAEDEARQRAEAERLAAEIAAKRKAAEEAQLKAEAQRLAQIEAERKQQEAEAQARAAAAAEAKRKADEAEALQRAEAERQIAEIAAKRKASEDAQIKAETERLAQIEAERRQQDAEAKAKADAERKADEAANPNDKPGLKSCEAQLEDITKRRKIFFKSASSELRKIHAKILDAIAALSKRCIGITIIVSGHTDFEGDEQANQQLSEERAEAVRAALVERGVDSKQLEVRGYAWRQPSGGTLQRGARASDRRAEFTAVPRTAGQNNTP